MQKPPLGPDWQSGPIRPLNALLGQARRVPKQVFRALRSAAKGFAFGNHDFLEKIE